MPTPGRKSLRYGLFVICNDPFSLLCTIESYPRLTVSLLNRGRLLFQNGSDFRDVPAAYESMRFVSRIECHLVLRR